MDQSSKDKRETKQSSSSSTSSAESKNKNKNAESNANAVSHDHVDTQPGSPFAAEDIAEQEGSAIEATQVIQQDNVDKDDDKPAVEDPLYGSRSPNNAGNNTGQKQVEPMHDSPDPVETKAKTPETQHDEEQQGATTMTISPLKPEQNNNKPPSSPAAKSTPPKTAAPKTLGGKKRPKRSPESDESKSSGEQSKPARKKQSTPASRAKVAKPKTPSPETAQSGSALSGVNAQQNNKQGDNKPVGMDTSSPAAADTEAATSSKPQPKRDSDVQAVSRNLDAELGLESDEAFVFGGGLGGAPNPIFFLVRFTDSFICFLVFWTLWFAFLSS
jgi:hypothetical protein